MGGSGRGFTQFMEGRKTMSASGDAIQQTYDEMTGKAQAEERKRKEELQKQEAANKAEQERMIAEEAAKAEKDAKERAKRLALGRRGLLSSGNEQGISAGVNANLGGS